MALLGCIGLCSTLTCQVCFELLRPFSFSILGAALLGTVGVQRTELLDGRWVMFDEFISCPLGNVFAVKNDEYYFGCVCRNEQLQLSNYHLWISSPCLIAFGGNHTCIHSYLNTSSIIHRWSWSWRSKHIIWFCICLVELAKRIDPESSVISKLSSSKIKSHFRSGSIFLNRRRIWKLHIYTFIKIWPLICRTESLV